MPLRHGCGMGAVWVRHGCGMSTWLRHGCGMAASCGMGAAWVRYGVRGASDYDILNHMWSRGSLNQGLVKGQQEDDPSNTQSVIW